jgi:hypothetical protein
MATAHKIARTVSHMLKYRVPYHDSAAAEYNKRFRERALKYLQKKAAKLGYTLSPASQSHRQPELFLSTRLFGQDSPSDYLTQLPGSLCRALPGPAFPQPR